MSDAGPEALSTAQYARLQLAGYLSSALSLLGSLYVLVHFGYVHWRPRYTPETLPFQFRQLRQRRRMDLMAKLVLVLALFDLVAIAARAVGRGFVTEFALCRAQAAVIQVANLASCLWICCIAFNLYRWIAGESDATRQRRFPLFLAIAVVPGGGLAIFHLMTNKYGDATYYCWLDEIRYMFLNFYLFYLLMIVFNLVLLALIHFNMKQRVERHDTVEADTSSTLIRRKLVLYIVVFVAHRTPMMVYRMFEAGGLESISVGLAMQVIQDLNGFSNAIVYGGIFRRRTQELPPPRDCEADSVSSPTDSIAGGLPIKKRTTAMGDDHEAAAATPGTALTQSGRNISCGSDNGSLEELTTSGKSIFPRKNHNHDEHTHSYRSWQQRLQKRFSLHHTPPPPPPAQPKKVSIFASTFNMGEKNANENELHAWIPLGHDIYVIGVQECMDLYDLQTKIRHHLESGSTGKFEYYSREIGKRATALGYHGYIALTIFVRATAVAYGRFQMPRRQSSNKNAQEVFRGKSLLLFGRASNKGAVGMSFRYDETSFAFVTCHLASDSSSLKRGKRKKSAMNSSTQSMKSVEANLLNTSGSGVARNSGDSGGSKSSVSEGSPMEMHQPPSKVRRRNQDAMEILQQLYLDEEDYGFGFPHLHHHSFILGDLNYRLNRKGATPSDMLELLVNAGSEHHQTCEDVFNLRLSSPCSPAMLQTCASELSPHAEEADFRQCITPKIQSPTPIAAPCKTRRHERGRTGTSVSNSGSSSAPFLLRTLVEDHDELYQLCRSQQLFHGFQESEITFFPTFRRIRGQALQEPFDTEVFRRNYSLMANHGGYRVPSYTDRILFSSLAGSQDSLRCLAYDSCETVTTSDHKPVSACFEVELLPTQSPSATTSAENALWNANSSDANPMVLHADPTVNPFAAARMKDMPGACELRLRIEFRSIHWIDAIDSAVFDRAEHVQFGFLFPLPCEDVFAPQRKLHEVAEHLTFGGSDGGNTGGMGFASTITPTSNFHTLKWHEFVNGGLRYHTLAGPIGRKHVAVVLRSLSRGRSMSKTSSASRLLGSSTSPSPQTSANSMASTCSPTPHANSTGAASSFSSEKLFGHGTFCAEGMTKKREVSVPLTLGGRLLGRLQLRVSLQMRQRK